MIYQLCHDDRLTRPPFSPLYRCLTMGWPDCLPELANEDQGIIYCSRHLDMDSDSWIGFTSYRALEKTPIVFHDAAWIETALRSHDMLAWLWLDVGNLAARTERKVPGITEAFRQALAADGETIPPEWFLHRFGAFSNYWIMSKRNCAAYMRWALPKILWVRNEPAFRKFCAFERGHLERPGVFCRAPGHALVLRAEKTRTADPEKLYHSIPVPRVKYARTADVLTSGRFPSQSRLPETGHHPTGLRSRQQTSGLNKAA